MQSAIPFPPLHVVHSVPSTLENLLDAQQDGSVDYMGLLNNPDGSVTLYGASLDNKILFFSDCFESSSGHALMDSFVNSVSKSNLN